MFVFGIFIVWQIEWISFFFLSLAFSILWNENSYSLVAYNALLCLLPRNAQCEGIFLPQNEREGLLERSERCEEKRKSWKETGAINLKICLCLHEIPIWLLFLTLLLLIFLLFICCTLKWIYINMCVSACVPRARNLIRVLFFEVFEFHWQKNNQIFKSVPRNASEMLRKNKVEHEWKAEAINEGVWRMLCELYWWLGYKLHRGIKLMLFFFDEFPLNLTSRLIFRSFKFNSTWNFNFFHTLSINFSLFRFKMKKYWIIIIIGKICHSLMKFYCLIIFS